MQSEWRWFGATLGDSLLRPRRFASTLGREHYGLAGVVVVPVAVSSVRPDVRAPLLALALLVSVVVLARFGLAVALNLAGVVGRAAVIVGAVALAAMGIVLADQLGRIFFTTLSYAPQILAPPAASVASGRDVSIEGASFSVPSAWRDAQQ